MKNVTSILVLSLAVILSGCAATKTEKLEVGSKEHTAFKKSTMQSAVKLLTRNFRYGTYRVNEPNKPVNYIVRAELFAKIKTYPHLTTVALEEANLGTGDVLVTILEENGVKSLKPNSMILKSKNNENTRYEINATSLIKLFTVGENRRRLPEKLNEDLLKIYNEMSFPQVIED